MERQEIRGEILRIVAVWNCIYGVGGGGGGRYYAGLVDGRFESEYWYGTEYTWKRGLVVVHN